MKKHIISFLAALILSLVFSRFIGKVHAGEIYIPVGKARVKKSLLAFPQSKYLTAMIQGASSNGAVRDIRETLLKDLEFMNLFTMQSESAFIEKPDAGISLDKFRISDWTTIGTEFLIKSGVSITGSNIAFELRLYDVLGTKQILGKRYVATLKEGSVIGHTAANDIVEALTGRSGIFFTKLAMVCKNRGIKEIWITDFDGGHAHQLTSHQTLAFSPAWSPDNKKLAYSLYSKNRKNIKNIDLYEYDFQTKQSRLLSNRVGINSGAAYSPDGKSIALTMSFLGNPDIFLLELGSRNATRLTKSWGFDVDPSFSPDGKSIAFVSSRSGQPMVYTASINALLADSKTAERQTFAGKYNASPSFSPDGTKIAFAGDVDGRFDLFVLDLKTKGIERLTKNEGSNEDPYFSPDGNFIAFSSTRSGSKKVYLISSDGSYTTPPLSNGLGECEAPKWSWAAAVPF